MSGKLKGVLIAIGAIILIGVIAGGGEDDKKENVAEVSTEETSEPESKPEEEIQEPETEEEKPEPEEEEVTKEKYKVGETWENKTIKVTYTNCYEFTDYDQYNAPADGNKIICAEFEFENIGNSDASVMYTDFHGYADGYEVNQSYAPEGTGLEFSVKMSAGRKGTGKVAFEVPENSSEIEIEFSPNFWTSENVIFVYE